MTVSTTPHALLDTRPGTKRLQVVVGVMSRPPGDERLLYDGTVDMIGLRDFYQPSDGGENVIEWLAQADRALADAGWTRVGSWNDTDPARCRVTQAAAQ